MKTMSYEDQMRSIQENSKKEIGISRTSRTEMERLLRREILDYFHNVENPSIELIRQKIQTFALNIMKNQLVIGRHIEETQQKWMVYNYLSKNPKEVEKVMGEKNLYGFLINNEINNTMLGDLCRQIRKEIKEGIRTTNQNNYIEKGKEAQEKYLKEYLILSLENIGKFLKRYNCFSQYGKQFRKIVTMIGLSIKEMKFSNTLIEGKRSVSLEKLLTREVLEEKGILELSILNLFWENRLAKAMVDLSDALYSIDKILPTTKEELRSQDEKNLYLKKAFLNEVIDRIVTGKIIWSNPNTKSVRQAISQKYRKMKITENQTEEEEKPFELEKDILSHIQFISAENSVYKTKSENVLFLILYLRNHNRIKNWGVCLDEFDILDNRILIGLDYKGYVGSCMVHVKRDKLINGLEQLEENCILPIYEGMTVRQVKGRFVKNPVMMPLNSRQRKYLRKVDKKYKERLKTSDFSEDREEFEMVHYWVTNADNKLPDESMQEERIKGRQMKRRKPRKYVDIKTGRFYQKDRKGNFIELAGEKEIERQ